MSVEYARKYETEGKGPPMASSHYEEAPHFASYSTCSSIFIVLIREIATTIDVVLTDTWPVFVYTLGYKEDDIGTSITEPTSKIFRLLQRNVAQFNGNIDKWWEHFLKCLNSFGNADLTSQVQEVYTRWKESQNQPNSRSFEKVYPSLNSGMLMNEDDYNQANQDNDIVPDRPEISMEINVVAEALDKVSSNPRTGDIAKWLRDGVPRIIQIERELKSQKALRGIFEKETHDLKDQLNKKDAELEVLNNECLNLRVENEELKKVKQDEHLNEFDFVTRKEAQDIKEEEKIQKQDDQRSDVLSPEVLKAEITKAKRENAQLKKQIDEIVKVNHSWDEHYKKMKSQYEKQTIGLRKEMDVLLAVRSENDHLKDELTKLQQAMSEDQKKHDMLLLQAKERIDTLEKENADKQDEFEQLKSRFDRVQGYARTLTSQRKDAESEISRLNQALAQKMTISSSQRGTVEIQKSQTSPIPKPTNAPLEIPRSMESLLATSLEGPPPPTKRVESMSEAELREELEVLRQQTDVYRSDFEHERQDRQRIMGELDETKKELKKYQRELKAPKPQVIRSKQRQLLEDEQFAQQLQREEDRALQQQQVYRPTTRVQPRYQPQQYQYSRPGQPGYKDYYTVQDIQNIQVPHKDLVPHGGSGGRGQAYYRGPPNYAANDMWIDGTDGRLEIDGEDDTDGNRQDDNNDNSSQGTNEDNTCPRCKRSFSHDDEFAVHLDRCVTD